MPCILTSLLTGLTYAYNVADLARLKLQIDGPGGTATFDLSLNDESRFSAEVQNLDAGSTSISLSGYGADGTEMYSGDWDGAVRADGKPTQVALYMVDMKPDIDYASLSNVAPFFTAIEVEPSNIAHNETLTIRTRARDLDGTKLNYTVMPLDPLYGDLQPCATGSGETCVTTYRSSADDSNGLKSFEVAVTDGSDHDQITGAFNVRAYGGVDIAVTFNSRPGASAIDVSPTNFLTPDEPAMMLDVSLFDDQSASWTYSVRGNGTECDSSRLSGDIDGSFTTQRDTRVTFTAGAFDDASSCVIDLRVMDHTSPALEYHLSVPVVVGTEVSNAAPHVLYAYATSRHPSSGDTVRYVVRAMDDHHALHAAWDTGVSGTVLHTGTGNSSMPHDFTMDMVSSGLPGTVRCTLTDEGGLQHVTTFDVLAPSPAYVMADPGFSCPAGTERVTNRNQCLDAASQLGHAWNENLHYAWAPRTDGGGFCVQCLYCNDHPITYMMEYNSVDPYLRHYCQPSSSSSARRLASVDASASDAPSPFLFGIDMRIESGTLYVTSNQVPATAEPAAVTGSSSSSRPYALLGGTSAGFVALVAAKFAYARRQRHSQEAGHAPITPGEAAPLDTEV